MLEARVSNINLYRTWKGQEDLDVPWLVHKLTHDEPTEKMKAGTAFHKAVELSSYGGTHYVLTANGYTFDIVCDVDIAMPQLREAKVWKDYGELAVNGTVDGLLPKVVMDLKTTEYFDADNYLDGLQWRFYLDMTGADRFDWHVFQMSQRKEQTYEIYGYHQLSQYRYQGLHADCLKAAEEYREFAARFLA